jgi:enoyl-CoA hydratase/carnithine racemase
MHSDLVIMTVEDGVAVLALNNPPVNGYSHEMFRALDEAILRARFDTSVHVIVLRGAGDKAFCAGADIAMLRTADPEFKYQFCLHANETLLRLEHTPKLVIAAINGHCVGGGLEIAMAADLRIAKKDCGKLGLPEVMLGVLPGTGGTQRLSRMLGKAKAIELMVQGETFDAETALSLGLLNAIYPADTFFEDVMAFARSFCPPNKPARAVGLIKRAVQSGAEVPLESGLTLERELQQRLFTSQDAAEGITAFLEKRPPTFQGR